MGSMKLIMFTKHLQTLCTDDMARTVKGLGFSGVDLTTRPNGSITPERVREELPAAAETLARQGLDVGMLTTAVTGAEEPFSEDIFRTASELGVKYLKLGYFRYEGFGSLAEQIDRVRLKLWGIARLAERYGVTACVHTHYGDFIPESGELLYLLLRGFEPELVAAYVDPGNMAVEGGLSGWKMALDLLAPQIRLVAIKDFQWFQVDDAQLGKKAWRPKLVPLEEGIVRWPEVFDCLQAIGFAGHLSVASEYQGSSSWRDLSVEELIKQTRRDLAYLRKTMESAEARSGKAGGTRASSPAGTH